MKNMFLKAKFDRIKVDGKKNFEKDIIMHLDDSITKGKRKNPKT